jgi:hypothetical protein
MTWTGSAVTVAALVVTSRPLVAAACRPERPRRSVPAAACILVVMTAAGVALTGPVGLPAWSRAAWALVTAAAAGWIAVRGRSLTEELLLVGEGSAAGLAVPRADPPLSATTPRPARMAAAPGCDVMATDRGRGGASLRRRRSAGGLAGRTPARHTVSDALSAQDDLVQTLVVASYALQMGDDRRARVAVDGALRRSKATLDSLLQEHDGLVRAKPAALFPPRG